MSRQASKKMIQTIRSLLERASHESANEHERQVCLTKANELMEKHALTEDNLNAALNPLGSMSLSRGNNMWIRHIFNACSQYFGTFLHYAPATKTLELTGRQNQLITTKIVSDFIIGSIRREWTSYKKDNPDANNNSFCVGSSTAFYYKVIRLIEDRERMADQEGDDSDALALVSEQRVLIAEAEALVPYKLSKSSGRSKTTDQSSFDSGSSFGSSLNVNAHMSSGKASKQRELN